jgi:hypothetical protein
VIAECHGDLVATRADTLEPVRNFIGWCEADVRERQRRFIFQPRVARGTSATLGSRRQGSTLKGLNRRGDQE